MRTNVFTMTRREWTWICNRVQEWIQFASQEEEDSSIVNLRHKKATESVVQLKLLVKSLMSQSPLMTTMMEMQFILLRGTWNKKRKHRQNSCGLCSFICSLQPFLNEQSVLSWQRPLSQCPFSGKTKIRSIVLEVKTVMLKTCLSVHSLGNNNLKPFDLTWVIRRYGFRLWSHKSRGSRDTSGDKVFKLRDDVHGMAGSRQWDNRL